VIAKEIFEYSGTEIKSYDFYHGYHFLSYAEEWERYISELQNLPNRFCYIKHKIEGGLILIRTAEIEPAWQILNLTKNQFLDYLFSIKFGKRYLLKREKIKPRVLVEEIKKEEILIKEKPKEIFEVISESKEFLKEIPKEISFKIKEKKLEGRGSPKHRYLQEIIKRFAREKGFKAIIEKQVNGKWIDVSSLILK